MNSRDVVGRHRHVVRAGENPITKAPAPTQGSAEAPHTR